MPAGRRCPQCPAILTNGERYCPTHARVYEGRRGSRQARGYDSAHERERARYAARLALGEVIPCCLCGKPIDGRWALDHTPDRSSYRGIAHEFCNNSDGGRRSRDPRG